MSEVNKDIILKIGIEPNEKLVNRRKLRFGLRKEQEGRAQQETIKRAKTEDEYKEIRTRFNEERKQQHNNKKREFAPKPKTGKKEIRSKLNEEREKKIIKKKRVKIEYERGQK